MCLDSRVVLIEVHAAVKECLTSFLNHNACMSRRVMYVSTPEHSCMFYLRHAFGELHPIGIHYLSQEYTFLEPENLGRHEVSLQLKGLSIDSKLEKCVDFFFIFGSKEAQTPRHCSSVPLKE